MTARLPAGARATEVSAQEEALGLLCADPELVQAEFEAIVAAEWPRPPEHRAAVPAQHRRPSGGPAPGRARVRYIVPSPDLHRGVDGWGRQRSPPDRTD
jgi:hypothetical protein